ncbi:MAG TPA: LysM peptidoglycan-binding domain-containing protein [Streptosporangiaceae bacterium]|nr:LysM peptidoglycan-binding domain-containing protein [Streptosporangiaceae bacterium]
MDTTSAAEANLNARVRPQIVALRAKTPYPKRRPQGAAAISAGGPRPALSLVGAGPAADGPGAARSGSGAGVRLSVVKLSAAEPPAAGRAVAGAGRPAAGARTPIKLTRRGRVVVGTLIGLAVATVAVLIWFGVAGQAEASSHVGPRLPASDSVSRVVVRPGDTLWEIAAKAEPNADPRATIGEILDLNSLTGTAVRIGQVLFVPKG